MARSSRVGARELKTRLGAYLRRVRGGETIVVTDRGQPAAELRPVPAARGDLDARLARLALEGRVTRPVRRRRSPFRPIAARRPLSSAVRADREDRF